MPWYRAGNTPILLGVLLAGGLALGGYLLLKDDGEPTASGNSTTVASTTTTAVTTTGAGTTTTTAASTTTATAATTTTAGGTTTTAGGTTTTSGTTTTAAAGSLDTALPPAYGSHTLAGGFLPDPFTAAATAGGPVDASYLGGGCFGWAAQAADFEIVRTAATGGLLRFYFIPDDPTRDTVLIINDPYGAWWCVDDSYGTPHPTIDFPTGDNGTYDVWLVSYPGYPAGTMIPGTFYVTEVALNHP